MSSKFGKRMSSILIRRKDSSRPASPSPLGASPPKTREASIDEPAPSIPQSDSPPSGSPILAPTQGSGRPASLKSSRSIRSIRSIFGKKTRGPAPVANEVVAEPEPMASEALTAEPESVDETADKVPVPAPEVESEREEPKSVEEAEPALEATPAPVEAEPIAEAQPEPVPEPKAAEPEPLEEEPVIVAKPEPEATPVPQPEPVIQEPEVPQAPTPPPVLTVETKPAEPIVTLAPPEDTMARHSELSPVPEEPRSAIVEASTSTPVLEASTSTAAPQEPTHTDANVQTDPEVVPSTSGSRQVATQQSRPNRKAEELTGLVWLTSHLMNNISAVLSRVVHLFRPVA